MPRNFLYTALSRAKSASGLYILGHLKLNYKFSDKDTILQELKRLEENCSIIWSIPLTSTDIYLHNVSSLNKHYEDLICDPVILQSKILILQETMTTSSDSFSIPGHCMMVEQMVNLESMVLVRMFTHVTQLLVNLYLLSLVVNEQ